MVGDMSHVEPLLAEPAVLPFEESYWTTRLFDKQISPGKEEHGGSGTVLTSSISLAATCIGTGLFALPFAFSTAGLGLGLGLLVSFTFLSFFMSYILCLCCDWTNLYSYEEIVVSSFGRRGSVFLEVTVIWLLMGAMISVLAVAGDAFTSMAQLFGVGIDDSDLMRTVLITADLLLVALPLSWMQRSNSLSFTNSIAVFCTVVVGAMLMVRGLASSSWQKSLVEHPKFRFEASTFKAIPIIMLSLGCQVQVPPVFGELQRRDLKTMSQALFGAGAGCFGIYGGVAVFGILAAGAVRGDEFVIPGNILESFHHNDHYAVSMRVLMAIAVTLVYPMLCLPCRSTLDHLVFGGGETLRRSSLHAQARHAVETLVILSATLFFSALEHDLATVFGLTGATAGALICYVLPPVCFLKLRYEQPETVRLSTKFIACLSVVSLACILPLATLIVWQEFKR